MAPRLSLTVLVENTVLTDSDLPGEAGLSFLLRTDGKKILFDTGLSGLFLVNAGKMGISLRDLDFLVFSHGHIDHTGGLLPLIRYLADTQPGERPSRKPGLIAHPRCFWPKEKDGKENGSRVSEEGVRQKFPARLSERPVWITDDLVFLGEIPETFDFERRDAGKREIRHPDGTRSPDYLIDDSALAFRSERGLVIITGCSHAGICTITEYARFVCDEQKIRDIIGGFHLLSPSPERMRRTSAYLGALHLEALHACHCTSVAAKVALTGCCPVQEVGTGVQGEW